MRKTSKEMLSRGNIIHSSSSSKDVVVVSGPSFLFFRRMGSKKLDRSVTYFYITQHVYIILVPSLPFLSPCCNFNSTITDDDNI